jgi:hypothetical protein
LGFGSGTSVSLTPDAVLESIRYARMFLLLDRAQAWLIAHTDTGGLCARCRGAGILLVLPQDAVKSRYSSPSRATRFAHGAERKGRSQDLMAAASLKEGESKQKSWSVTFKH